MNPQPGEQIEVKLVLDGPAPQPVTFTIDNPARLSVDLPGTVLALPSRRIDVNSGGVDTIVAAEASGRSRLVFNLDQLRPVPDAGLRQRRLRDRRPGRQLRAQPAPTGAAAPGGSRPATATSAAAVDKVDFRRGADGAGRILVSDQRPARPGEPEAGRRPDRDRFPEHDPARRVREALRRRRFRHAGQLVRRHARTATARASWSRPRATSSSSPTSRTATTCSRSGPRPKVAVVDPSKREYKGERLTLNFQDIETRAVLQLLAETSGQNIVVSDTVQGNVTLRLQNVPWDQAMDIVLRTKGLDKRQEGNVIFVAPTDELQAREKQMLESQKAIIELSPVRTEYLQVNYAKASDLAGAHQVAGQDLAALRPRQRLGGRAHQHAAAGGHGRAARRHPPAGLDARHPGQAGADRGAHRHRERHLQPRARRAVRQRVRRQLRQRRRPDVGRQQRPELGDRRPRPDHLPERPGRRRRGRQFGRDGPGARSLPRQPADREPGDEARHDAARFRLRRGPRDHGRAARRPRRGDLRAARDHRERPGGLHRAGPRNSRTRSPRPAARRRRSSRRPCCR